MTLCLPSQLESSLPTTIFQGRSVKPWWRNGVCPTPLVWLLGSGPPAEWPSVLGHFSDSCRFGGCYQSMYWYIYIYVNIYIYINMHWTYRHMYIYIHKYRYSCFFFKCIYILYHSCKGKKKTSSNVKWLMYQFLAAEADDQVHRNASLDLPDAWTVEFWLALDVSPQLLYWCISMYIYIYVFRVYIYIHSLRLQVCPKKGSTPTFLF